jgi:hypothetical protein
MSANGNTAIDEISPEHAADGVAASSDCLPTGATNR